MDQWILAYRVTTNRNDRNNTLYKSVFDSEKNGLGDPFR